MSTRVDIAVLLPDVLGTYSDAGNAVVLAQRARWRGVEARVLQVPSTEQPPTSCDIYLVGGGEDAAQIAAARWLDRHAGLRSALADRAVVLAVCAGFQLLGTTMADRAGRTYAGLGLFEAATEPGHRRAVGEVVSACTIPGVGKLTGFENHMGTTTLGPATTPLGRVERGLGNGVRDGGGHTVDGAVLGRVIGTYLHGPVLARNPDLADHLLALATGLELAAIELPDQDALRRTYLG